ncbi:MFS transporter [Hoyosella altamirensis]|uniref:MFS family permease n=1 Tax=Hoyosella altamirensis TaxID=616997 RepID=A0A839RIL9_9ACTN|nr:MFS transporter [Hoyosella altamirensis]MBB3036290.1 MFS family permease [Hoyosella altamirensis]
MNSSADPGTTRERDEVRVSRLRVCAIFAVNGLFIGVWAGLLPSLRDHFRTDARGIAVLLMVAGICAVIAMQIAGRWADRRGAKKITLAAVPIMAIGMCAVAAAPSYGVLVAAAAVFGVGNGMMDVAMNAVGVHVEARHKRPTMSLFHAFFSIGALAGAGIVLGSAVLTGGLRTVIVVSSLASVVIAVAGTMAVAKRLPQSQVTTASMSGPRRIPAAAWLLGVIALCFGMTEGTAMDWSSIHVTDVTNVSPGIGALGVVCVSGAMIIVRLLGDPLCARFGRTAIVRGGAIVAAAGFTVTVISDDLPVVLAAWLVVGLGVGIINPQIYAVAGHLGGGRTLAVVVGFGYTAFLIGPAIIGSLIAVVGIQNAMMLPIGLAVVVLILALWMPTAGPAKGGQRKRDVHGREQHAPISR